MLGNGQGRFLDGGELDDIYRLDMEGGDTLHSLAASLPNLGAKGDFGPMLLECIPHVPQGEPTCPIDDEKLAAMLDGAENYLLMPEGEDPGLDLPAPQQEPHMHSAGQALWAEQLQPMPRSQHQKRRRPQQPHDGPLRPQPAETVAPSSALLGAGPAGLGRLGAAQAQPWRQSGGMGPLGSAGGGPGGSGPVAVCSEGFSGGWDLSATCPALLPPHGYGLSASATSDHAPHRWTSGAGAGTSRAGLSDVHTAPAWLSCEAPAEQPSHSLALQPAAWDPRSADVLAEVGAGAGPGRLTRAASSFSAGARPRSGAPLLPGTHEFGSSRGGHGRSRLGAMCAGASPDLQPPHAAAGPFPTSVPTVTRTADRVGAGGTAGAYAGAGWGPHTLMGAASVGGALAGWALPVPPAAAAPCGGMHLLADDPCGPQPVDEEPLPDGPMSFEEWRTASAPPVALWGQLPAEHPPALAQDWLAGDGKAADWPWPHCISLPPSALAVPTAAVKPELPGGEPAAAAAAAAALQRASSSAIGRVAPGCVLVKQESVLPELGAQGAMRSDGMKLVGLGSSPQLHALAVENFGAGELPYTGGSRVSAGAGAGMGAGGLGLDSELFTLIFGTDAAADPMESRVVAVDPTAVAAMGFPGHGQRAATDFAPQHAFQPHHLGPQGSSSWALSEPHGGRSAPLTHLSVLRSGSDGGAAVPYAVAAADCLRALDEAAENAAWGARRGSACGPSLPAFDEGRFQVPCAVSDTFVHAPLLLPALWPLPVQPLVQPTMSQQLLLLQGSTVFSASQQLPSAYAPLRAEQGVGGNGEAEGRLQGCGWAPGAAGLGGGLGLEPYRQPAPGLVTDARRTDSSGVGESKLDVFDAPAAYQQLRQQRAAASCERRTYAQDPDLQSGTSGAEPADRAGGGMAGAAPATLQHPPSANTGVLASGAQATASGGAAAAQASSGAETAAGPAAPGGGGAVARAGGRRAIGTLSRSVLRPHYHRPIKEVACGVGLSLSCFKKECRRLGVPRWPARKLQCLVKMRDTLLRDERASEKAKQELMELLAQNVEDIMDDPDAPMYKAFNKLRHDQYKLRSSSRRAGGGAGAVRPRRPAGRGAARRRANQDDEDDEEGDEEGDEEEDNSSGGESDSQDGEE